MWGSYKGQTQILFDGITLFNISGYNDNIGAINPLIVKDIEVIKAGYNANIGDRVGGVVNITGKSGNPEKLSAKLNITNLTTSGIINIPIAKRYSLQTSFRQTYYNLYNLDNIFNSSSKNKLDSYDTDYKFGDLNFKFSGSNNNGDNYYISLLGSNDNIIKEYDADIYGKTYSFWNENKKQQLGGALFYSKKWKNIGTTNTTVSYSDLESSFNNAIYYIDAEDPSNYFKNTSYTENSISDLSVKTDHYLPSIKRHSINFGLGFTNNTSTFRMDTTENLIKNNQEELNRLNGYIKDNISVTKKINIQPGLRVDMPLNSTKPFVQPRVNAEIKASKNLKVNLAWGIYNQFITESSIIDDFENQLYYWSICDNKQTPVLSGNHYISGLSYTYKDFTFNTELFFKKTDNLTRFISYAEKNSLATSKGEGRSYGIDFYIKKSIKKHDFWVAYTLSKTEELFSYFTSKDFQRAPHDQRHEIKSAALLNFNPYYISLNYVYGSGLANTIDISNNNKIIPYNRLDVAFLYKFNTKKIKLETGISALNVTNSENIRYNNFSNFPDQKTIYSKAMPFTVALNLNVGF